MVEEVRADCPALERVVYIGTAGLARAGRRAARTLPQAALAERAGELAATTRSTSSTRRGTTGFPKGATL